MIPLEVPAIARIFLLILFGGHRDAEVTASVAAATTNPSRRSIRRRPLPMCDYAGGDLQSLLEQVEAANEELTAANEEISARNDELLSQSDEFETTNEALLTANEALAAANHELTARNLEVTHLSADLTNVFSSVGIPIVLLDAQFCVRRFTPAAERVLGLGAGSIGNRIDSLEAEVGKTLLEMGALAIGELRPVEKSLQLDHKWCLVAARPYVTADRHIDGAVISILDVDEMKKGAERDARDYAELVVDTVRECLLVLDRDLRVLSANRAFCRTFRLDRQAVQGRSFRELGHGEWDVPALVRRLETLVEGDSFDDFRVDQTSPQLGTRTFLITARRIDRTSWTLLVMQDLTEWERARNIARQAEIEFRDVLTDAAEPILLTDSTGTIVFANRAAGALFLYEPEAMKGLAVEALVPAGSREQHRRDRKAYLSAPEARPMGRGRNLVARRKDGSEFAVEIALTPVMRESGRLVVCFVADVTKRREADERIRVYQERLRQLALDSALAEERERRRIAMGLHDRIGQSLTLAGMKLQSLREGVGGDAGKAVKEAKELIQQSIEDARTLTFDLSPPILYDLGLNAALAWLAEDIEKKFGLKVEVHAAETPLPLDDATAALLFRAIRELLTNVSKHASSPRASVSIHRSEGAAHVTVEDEGVGFDVGQLLSGAASQGFGLFSVREQIGRLGGKVEIESTRPSGTRVKLEIPLTGTSSAEEKS